MRLNVSSAKRRPFCPGLNVTISSDIGPGRLKHRATDDLKIDTQGTDLLIQFEFWCVIWSDACLNIAGNKKILLI